ncbi:Hypothetical predicted protein [Cloeon dipterum]|uniref:Uncharacterized protein n=1 Tax=Cloeon dipterum TaxID=197152 RepID=A0A8S1E2A0_9INSE|nr:Hypothetical predicted protein [Cloeon dipterum]
MSLLTLLLYSRLFRFEAGAPPLCTTPNGVKLNPNLAMHRFFTYPMDFHWKFTTDLALMLAEGGIYYVNFSMSSYSFLRCNFCELTIHPNQFESYFSSRNYLTVRNLIGKNHCEFDCKISQGDTKNEPMGKARKLDNNLESDRLFSMINKTACLPVEPFSAARSGFYSPTSLGEDKTVICAFCQLRLPGAQLQGEKPDEEHKLWSPLCRLMSGDKSAANVAIQTETVEIKKEVKIHTGASRPFNMLEEQNLPAAPLNPKYATLKNRIDSFKDAWPKSLSQMPEELARAGFFYHGVGDRVICFLCNLGLKDWDTKDDPIDQHCKWNSNCKYWQMSNDAG